MTKQLFDTRPEPILDLGTGYFNVHLNITPIIVDEVDEDGNAIKVEKFECDVMRTNNVTYGALVNTLIRKKYTIDAELALQRQMNIKVDEFAEYNDYCETSKAMVREVLKSK